MEFIISTANLSQFWNKIRDIANKGKYTIGPTLDAKFVALLTPEQLSALGKF